MTLDIRNLCIRSVSGIVYVGLIIGALLWGAVGLFCLCSLFAVIGSYELERNTVGKRENGAWMSTWLMDAAILVAMMWLASILAMPGIAFVIWASLLLLRFVFQIFIYEQSPLQAISVSVLAQFYIGIPLALLAFFAVYLDKPWTVICIIAMIWINDTGAYLVGTLAGRHKMFKRLSPKKSWEGFLGGLLFNIGAAFIYFYCFKLNSGFILFKSVDGWIFIGICVTCFATLGDLFESMLKRSLGIKDFGSIIPGHGGVLDRIDSLLFVVPGVLLLSLIASMFLSI